ncbi:hypothetical protein RO3G_00220 [Rhizopus delemar RA 99-880]|uniref:Uncharacterized protein n=1 Tax=Rhizopus delemar (strain RA 99-880 / ATCC MYA-4621 / FGSC 9543 / NRRL 43880) TaxID=246409 RepID=I1BH36_RHIO9|nr:hypothetical protein RO3G_00220 [Rhizopus delemar RA 99-880]|eukprot:EIE75516.1 hypothetical protein RO3G_00220 [Rhizopus delemar RA 99-880]
MEKMLHMLFMLYERVELPLVGDVLWDTKTAMVQKDTDVVAIPPEKKGCEKLPSLCRGHTNLLCIVPILISDRGSMSMSSIL